MRQREKLNRLDILVLQGKMQLLMRTGRYRWQLIDIMVAFEEHSSAKKRFPFQRVTD